MEPLDFCKMVEVNNKQELKDRSKEWKDDNIAYIKESGELLLYHNGEWLNFIEDH